MIVDMVPGLPSALGMVDTIIRLTVLAVMVLALVNGVQAALVVVRFARHLAGRSPHGGLAFWLPAFGSMRDARIWLGQWRALFESHDPELVKIRVDARLVVGRHVHLALLSQTWAIALNALAPSLI